MRIVIDTNVYVSFLLTRGETIRLVLDAWENHKFTLVCSPQIIVELEQVLKYPHLKSRIQTNEANALIESISTDSIMVSGKLTRKGITPDPKDDMIAACAIEGNADYIVSGDPHLLNLKQIEKIQIVSPREFITLL